tara:strand:+ start:4046 stop:4498 length:453 start_codon:yes stop_codon:yes gene_type:complete
MATFSLGYNNYTLSSFTNHTTAHSINNTVNKAVNSEPKYNVGSGIFSDGGNPPVVVTNFAAAPSGTFNFRGGNLSQAAGRDNRKADLSSRSTISYAGSVVRDGSVLDQSTTRTMVNPVRKDNYPGYNVFGTESNIQYIYAANFRGYVSYY